MAGASEIVELDAARSEGRGRRTGPRAGRLRRRRRVGQLHGAFRPTRSGSVLRGVAGDVADGKTVLLAAKVDGRIEGTVQLGLDMPPNQPHRGDVKKLLVHRGARKAGLAAALMQEIENAARSHGRWLLVLDTVEGGDGERVYTRLGWQRTGVIPDYALFPDGSLCDTVVFWKKVGAP